MAGLVQIWDVGRNCPVAFSLAPCDYSERHEAIPLFDRLGAGDLLIGDRGYPGYEFFRSICRRRARFLIRLPIGTNATFTEFAASGQDDTVILLTKRKNGTDIAGLPAIPMRLMRVVLPNGAIEILATNLWRRRGHERDTLARLYTQRWRIETAFREMKVFHALEQFSATYPDGIYQEIVAIQIFLLLTSELEAIARRETEDLPDRAKPPSAPADEGSQTLQVSKLRFNRLIVADNVIHLLRHAAYGGTAQVAAEMPHIIENLWKNRSYARNGRAYPRERKRSLGRFRTSGA
jgi:hypothetical protein